MTLPKVSIRMRTPWVRVRIAIDFVLSSLVAIVTGVGFHNSLVAWLVFLILFPLWIMQGEIHDIWVFLQTAEMHET